MMMNAGGGRGIIGGPEWVAGCFGEASKISLAGDGRVEGFRRLETAGRASYNDEAVAPCAGGRSGGVCREPGGGRRGERVRDATIDGDSEMATNTKECLLEVGDDAADDDEMATTKEGLLFVELERKSCRPQQHQHQQPRVDSSFEPSTMIDPERLDTADVVTIYGEISKATGLPEVPTVL